MVVADPANSRLIWIVLALAIWSPRAATQSAANARETASTQRVKPLAEFSRDVWTTRDGLPHNQVSAIRQTPDGYLWFATWEGVVRYNGVRFRVFDRSNTPALTDNGARSLHVMRNGSVLIGTARGGVATVDTQGRWRVWTTAEGLAQNEIWRAIEDRRGRIWVASESAGIDRIDTTGVRHFGKADGLPSEALLDLAEGKDGAIWVASALGVVRIEDDKVEAQMAGAGLPATGADDVEVARDGSVWVATRLGGFVRRPGSARFERVTPVEIDEVITKVLPEADDAALFGTANEGVLAFAGGRLDRLQNLRSPANNRVTALFRDREDSLWIGTSAALMRLRDTPFSTLTTEHGLADNYVRAVLESPDGTLWIGTSSGLATVPRSGATPTASTAGLPTESILSLARARDGGVWVGTYADGLMHYRDGRVVQRWTVSEGLVHNEVRAVIETRDGTVWVGTPLGLSRIRGDEIVSFGTETGLPQLFVRSLAQSRDGRLWVGTSKGVAISSGEAFQTLSLPLGMDAQDMFGFHEDERGIMWIASDRGLLRVEKDRVAAIGLDQGLPIDEVFTVVSDQLGNLWLSSSRGVMRLVRAEADAVTAGRRMKIEAEQFGEHDGLITAQANGGSSPPAAVTADGRVWFATAHGVAFVQPRELARFVHEALPAVIEEVNVEGHAVANTGTVVLAPGQRRIDIQYAALSYLAPSRIRYRFRLDGLDENWVEGGDGHNAQFTNLLPGDYRFRVAAMLPGGAWSDRETTLPDSVKPLWWQRPWVVMPLLALLIAALWLAYRARVHGLRANEARLLALVEHRTRDLQRRTEDLGTQTALLKAADTDKNMLLARMREQSEDFEKQAGEDALTGLQNRRSADAFLEAEIARAERDGTPLSIVLIDVDHFKAVNDGHSHAVGDAALRAVAEALQRQTRTGDLGARWGGEEFVQVLPGIDLAVARVIAERLRAAIASLDLEHVAPGLKFTISAGIAEHAHGESGTRLVSRADDLLYQAKRNGRNRVEA